MLFGWFDLWPHLYSHAPTVNAFTSAWNLHHYRLKPRHKMWMNVCKIFHYSYSVWLANGPQKRAVLLDIRSSLAKNERSGNTRCIDTKQLCLRRCIMRGWGGGGESMNSSLTHVLIELIHTVNNFSHRHNTEWNNQSESSESHFLSFFEFVWHAVLLLLCSQCANSKCVCRILYPTMQCARLDLSFLIWWMDKR